MKIGIFTNHYLPVVNGVVISIKTLKENLEKKGNEVYIFCAEDQFFNPKTQISRKDFSYKAIRIYHNHSIPITFPSFDFQIAKKMNLDIIHSQHTVFVGKHAVKIANRLKIPIVFTYNSQYNAYLKYLPQIMHGNITNTIFLQLTKSYLEKCDGIIVPSKGLKEEIIKMKVKKEVAVIPGNVDIKRFQIQRDVKLRKELGYTKDDIVLITVSRLSKEKNVSFLIEIFKKLYEKNKNYKLLIIGDGPERLTLEKEAKKYQDSIKFVGEISYTQIPQYYKVGDIFVYTSLFDTQGLVLIEAASSSLPIITLRNIGTSDFIQNNVNGYILPEVEDDFVNAIEKVVQNKDIRDKFVNYNNKYINSYTDNSDKILKFYKEVIDRYKINMGGIGIEPMTFTV